MDFLFQILLISALNMYVALKFLVIPALAFLVFSILYRGRNWLPEMRRALPESELVAQDHPVQRGHHHTAFDHRHDGLSRLDSRQ